MLSLLAVLLFLSEIVLWFGFGRWIYLVLNQSRIALILAIIGVALFIVIWGFLFSPKAAYRLAKFPRIITIVVSSLLIGFALYRQSNAFFGFAIMLGVALIQALGQCFIYYN